MKCKVVSALFESIEALQNERKLPRDYGTGQLLYHTEVRFLGIIYENPDVNATKLTKLLGVTKGAVTQMGTKLQEKGLIERVCEAKNKKEKHYHLTPLGEEARQGHVAYHAAANGKLCAYLHSLDETEAAVVLQFIETLKDCMPVSIFECTGDCDCKEELG